MNDGDSSLAVVLLVGATAAFDDISPLGFNIFSMEGHAK